VACQYPVDRVPLHTRFESRQGAGCAPTRRHVPCNTRPCHLAKVVFGAATCPMALDLASHIGRAPTQPRVSWIWTCWEGSEAATCPVALDPASLIRRVLAPPCVSWLRTRSEGSSAPRILRFLILPPYREGSWLPRILWFPMGCGSQT
jgi:hypothetical protein